MRAFFIISLCLPTLLFAAGRADDYLRIAQGTKAIIDAGFDISNMISAHILFPADSATHHCVFIGTTSMPNPDYSERVPCKNITSGFSSCVSLNGDNTVQAQSILSQCEFRI